jgi:OOP family OmpA-OmpF porin
MKKTIITSAAFLITLVSINAQDKKEKVEKGFNRLSVEFNAGPNKAIKPFAAGYSSSNEGKLNAISANHYDLGLRYMLTTRFGLKFDLANDKFTNQSGSSSLPFETQQYRIGLQGVVNAGRIMGFEDFTKSIGLLAHGGIQVSQFTSNMGVNDGVSELNGGIMFGVTPQIRITNKLVFTADFTVLSNVRQHLNWDGSTSDQANNLTGQMFNTSLGLTYYFGKNEKHADWFIPVIEAIPDPEVAKRLDAMDALMNDTDRDGIVDHLDTENNTPTGVTVDSKGRFIDANKNGTPDELEPKDVKDGKDGNTSVAQSDAIKMLIEKGFVNVFYDVNKDLPNTGSMNNVYYIIKFLKAYPETKATLSGSTDLNGSEAKNIGLSQRRAQNLYNVIIANGVDASRVSVLGNGVDKEYTTDSATGLGLARRVSISLE